MQYSNQNLFKKKYNLLMYNPWRLNRVGDNNSNIPVIIFNLLPYVFNILQAVCVLFLYKKREHCV